MPPNFYNLRDQAIYSAGDFFIPQEKYRAAPYNVNNPAPDDPADAGIPAIYQSGGGGGGYTGGISDLTGDFFKTTSDRQNRLTELNRPLQAAQFPSFPGPRTPGGFDAQAMYNKASADLNNPFNRLATTETFSGTRPAIDVMNYADDIIDDYRMQYATGQLGPSFIPAEKPTVNRRINDFIYDKLGLTRPQSADQILEEGYNKPYGIGGPGILGAILGKMDNYSNLPVADQAFIAKNMGYTGPTVFGENTTGGSKDPFGLNVRSAFGNYAERVGVESEKLGDALSSTGAIGGKKDFQGATFNPETGMFEADDDSNLTPEQVAALNQRTKMVRAKYNFYTKQNQDYADTVKKAAEIQAAKDIAASKTAPQRQEGGGGGGNLTRSREQGGLGLSASQAQAVSAANQAAGMSGWGLADGGRVPYMDGGIVDMLEIYD